MSIKIAALMARAEKTEAALIAADKEIVELEAEAVALKADLARAVKERDAALVLYKAIHDGYKPESELDELWLVNGVIVRKRPDETLDQAVAREIEQRPKVASIIRGLAAPQQDEP